MSEHVRIFGERPAVRVGRWFLCRQCGDMHARGAVPHNCREPQPPKADYATPMLAPRFVPFVAERIRGVVIGDRRDKREYMARNELVEWDAGVTCAPSWAEQKEYERGIVQDIKRAIEMDPAERRPLERIGETDTGGAGDIDVGSVETVP